VIAPADMTATPTDQRYNSAEARKAQQLVRAAFSEHLTNKEYHRLIRIVLKMAKRGDKWALKMVLKYTAPLPAQKHEVKDVTSVDQKQHKTLADLFAPLLVLPLAMPPGLPQPHLRRLELTNDRNDGTS
jgi:hypothetical protein